MAPDPTETISLQTLAEAVATALKVTRAVHRGRGVVRSAISTFERQSFLSVVNRIPEYPLKPRAALALS
jgi:hypothetical protein